MQSLLLVEYLPRKVFIKKKKKIANKGIHFLVSIIRPFEKYSLGPWEDKKFPEARGNISKGHEMIEPVIISTHLRQHFFFHAKAKKSSFLPL